jgi:hypothetical protein
MKKTELSELLHETGLPVNEWVSSKQNESLYPRIVYWPYVDKKVIASDGAYEKIRTYQISIYAQQPDTEEIEMISDMLNECGVFPEIYHEYVKEDKIFHSFMSIEVIDDE